MSADLAKLRKKASELEAKKDLSGAIAAYREIIDLFEAGEAEPLDIPLYNRVGDLLMRDGRSADAIQLWERAIEHYMDGGFLNPAIALANKILRASPGRTAAYYTLGRCLAQKGLRTEARQNFLEYATRMQRAGNLDEAFRALKELADLVPEQDDVRVMLAEELAKADRVAEAVEQLQLAHARLTDAGKTDEAAAIATRARELDPMVAFEGMVRVSRASSGGLVFLDLDGQPNAVVPAPAVEPMPERLDGFETTSLAEPLDGPPLGLETVGVEPSFSARASTDAPLEFIDLGGPSPAASAPTEIEPVDLDFALELTSDLSGVTADPQGPPAHAGPPRLSLLDLSLMDVGGFDLPASAGAVEASSAPKRRPTSSVLLRPIDLLRADLDAAPDDIGLRRAYGEALVDEGQREAGIRELETALSGLEAAGDVDAARQVAEDLVRLVPTALPYHRRRVDLLLAAGARGAAVDAALVLGELLSAEGEVVEARGLYARVLQLVPDDLRAQAALAALTPQGADLPSAGDAVATAPLADAPESVAVKAWFQPTARPSTARVVMPGAGIEDGPVAFDEMLSRFKDGIETAVEASDHRAHYDLGVAYREMGLLDEAIAQFQKAVRTAPNRIPVIEALGGCFLEKGQPAIAVTVLRRALSEPGVTDDALLGVLYLLAESAAARGDQAESVACLERVIGIDIGFRDAASRLETLQSGGAEPPTGPKKKRSSRGKPTPSEPSAVVASPPESPSAASRKSSKQSSKKKS
jgi:tetratricopeptide (TPR) repeat protein